MFWNKIFLPGPPMNLFQAPPLISAVLRPVRCSRAARWAGAGVSTPPTGHWLPSGWGGEIPGRGGASKEMGGNRVPAWLETSASFAGLGRGFNRRSGSRVANATGCPVHQNIKKKLLFNDHYYISKKDVTNFRLIRINLFLSQSIPSCNLYFDTLDYHESRSKFNCMIVIIFQLQLTNSTTQTTKQIHRFMTFFSITTPCYPGKSRLQLMLPLMASPNHEKYNNLMSWYAPSYMSWKYGMIGDV
jgi:hypothetical protein